MRRSRLDLIEVWKLFNREEDIKWNLFFKKNNEVNEHSTRGHSLKLYANSNRLDIRKYFFSQRVVSVWNSLPEDVVVAGTLNKFKSGLKKIFERRGGYAMSS